MESTKLLLHVSAQRLFSEYASFSMLWELWILLRFGIWSTVWQWIIDRPSITVSRPVDWKQNANFAPSYVASHSRSIVCISPFGPCSGNESKLLYDIRHDVIHSTSGGRIWRYYKDTLDTGFPTYHRPASSEIYPHQNIRNGFVTTNGSIYLMSVSPFRKISFVE